MNTSDSERIASFLEKQGFVLAKKIEVADLVVFNTCGIRQAAENRAYGMINNLKKQATRNKKQIKIIMTGCLANRKDVQIRMRKIVDLFTEIKDFSKNVSSILYGVFSMNSTIPNTKKDYLCIKPKHINKFQALVPIMTGCNNFCSYCVVPYARGIEISRPAVEIEKEIRTLIKKGYKHIILLGQNVNSYHGEKNINFSKLLKIIDKIPGNFWISFVSSHPKDFSDELIETIAKCKKVCEWVHLPIQAGNDKILEKMNRRYSKAHYLGLIKKIKLAFKKYKSNSLYSISSDIIVGFPSETKKQFMDSEEVMQKAKFDMVFFGQFSPRPGTIAWKMKDNVSRKEKSRREKFLNEILRKTALENNKKYVGKIIEVLIEKQGLPLNFVLGKTRTMKNVKIESGKKNLVGKIVKAKIVKANVWNLEGNF